MTRSIGATLVSTLQQATSQPFVAVQFLFDSGTLRLWSGIGSYTFGTDVYSGVGDFLSIAAVKETSDMSADSMTITLAGQNAATVSLALQEPYQYRKATVHLGVWTNAAHTTYAFYKIFGGDMDTMSIRDDGDSSIITMTIENALAAFDRSNNFRYTQESQQALYPGDTFFSFVTDLQDKEITWGRK